MEVKANNPYCGNNRQNKEKMLFVNRRNRNTFTNFRSRQGKKVMSLANQHMDSNYFKSDWNLTYLIYCIIFIMVSDLRMGPNELFTIISINFNIMYFSIRSSLSRISFN